MVAMSSTDIAFIDQTVADVQRESINQGFTLNITTPDRGDIAKAYGLGNRRPAIPMTIADRMRIGSTSKTFIAKLILREMDRGTLTLDSKLSQFVTGVPDGNIITIRDMLTMRSGVYDYQTNAAFRNFGINPVGYCVEPTSQLKYIRGNSNPTPPDTKFEYTNSNYILLGEVLRVVTGRDWRDLIQNDILTPLGMTETTIPAHQDWMMPNPSAHGFGVHMWGAWAGLDQDQTNFNPDVFGCAGAMISSARDLQIWGAKGLRDGFLLKPETHLLQQTFFHDEPYSFEGPTVFGYGLGSFRLGRWLGHDGSVPGFTAQCMYDPVTGAVFAGLENYQSPDVAIFSKVFRRIARYLYPDSMP